MRAFGPELFANLPELALLVLVVAGGVRLGRAHPAAGRAAVAGALLLLALRSFEIVLLGVLVPDPTDGEDASRFLASALAVLSALSFLGASLLSAAIFLGRHDPAAPRAEAPQGGRTARLPAVAALLLLYAAIPIFAGHGIGTVGMLLVLGRSDAWIQGQAFGWLGLAAASVSLFLDRDAHLATLGGSALCLIASAGAFAAASDAFGLSAAGAIPFLAVAVFVAVRCRSLFASTPTADPAAPRKKPEGA